MHRTAKEYLHGLERTGEYVFHGSHKKLSRLEPRQPTTSDEKTGRTVPDGEPAVCATNYADIAIFRSLISGNRAIEKEMDHYSSFNVKEGKPTFSTTQESLDRANNPGIVGYVHIFKREGFKKRDDMEWRSKSLIEPIKVIEVHGNDLPNDIQIVSLPTRSF
ncbi:hypothetical protein ACFL0F_01640 [Patescibacteria group bacterium]